MRHHPLTQELERARRLASGRRRHQNLQALTHLLQMSEQLAGAELPAARGGEADQAGLRAHPRA